MCVYIYIQNTERFLTSSFPCFEGQISELTPPPVNHRAVPVHENLAPQMLLMP